MVIQQESRFSVAPTLDNKTRSIFKRPFKHLTSFNVGDLVPLMYDDILPGDTVKMQEYANLRLETLKKPIFDDLYFDLYYFFVPLRLVYGHCKEFFGENDEGDWEKIKEYTIPQITAPSGGWKKGDLASYFVRIGVDNFSFSKLYFNAYALIYNEFFRDQNFQKSIPIDLSDNDVVGVSGGSDIVIDTILGASVCKAFKYHDYFTSCLPSTAKTSEPVTIPLGDYAPVIYSDKVLSGTYADAGQPYEDAESKNAVFFNNGSGNTLGFYDEDIKTYNPASNEYNSIVADLSNATASTVLQIRRAFQLQAMAELDARSGTRYISIIKAHFGVTNPDYRLQRPEFLGGSHSRLNIQQVVQGEENANYKLGNLGAFSHTVTSGDGFVKSFTEHGILMALGVVRYKHSYQQGLDRQLSRKVKTDFYWPLLDGIGEQAVLNKEIFLSGTSTDDEVFGYQERYAEYRYKQDKVSGEFSSDYAQSRDDWHLADDFSTTPALSSSFLQEDKSNVDRIIIDSAQLSDQVSCDIYFTGEFTRLMQMYSIPHI